MREASLTLFYRKGNPNTESWCLFPKAIYWNQWPFSWQEWSSKHMLSPKDNKGKDMLPTLHTNWMTLLKNVLSESCLQVKPRKKIFLKCSFTWRAKKLGFTAPCSSHLEGGTPNPWSSAAIFLLSGLRRSPRGTACNSTPAPPTAPRAFQAPLDPHNFCSQQAQPWQEHTSSQCPWGADCPAVPHLNLHGAHIASEKGWSSPAVCREDCQPTASFPRVVLPTLAQRSCREWKDMYMELKPVHISWSLDHGIALTWRNIISFKCLRDTGQSEAGTGASLLPVAHQWATSGAPLRGEEVSAGVLCSPQAVPWREVNSSKPYLQRLHSQDFF